MKSKDYYELLSDPRWQRKRLEIMQRDNFTCQHCGSTDKTLHVHHKYYLTNKFPWDYCNTALITLCDDCHKEEHNNIEIPYLIGELNKFGFTNKMIEDILRGILLQLTSFISVSDIKLAYKEDSHYVLENNVSWRDYIDNRAHEFEE